MASNTTFIDPFSVNIDLVTGQMENPRNHLVRTASDMRGYYRDEAALERLIREQHDPLHYEVFEVPVPQECGHLMYCISKLQPGQVGDEFFMTKGHYHSMVERAEIYLCLQGQGYMAMKTSDGRWSAEKMARGTMVYVPPYWAHRSINVGGKPLVSYCIYPGDAGHNYGDIAKQGFPKRVFQRGNGIVIESECET